MTASTPAPQAHLDALERTVEGRPNAAALFYALAESHWESGDAAAYARFFRRAFLLDPVTHIGRSSGISGYAAAESAALNARALALIEHDVCFSPVIAALAITDAQLGRATSAQYLMNCDRFLACGTIDSPPDTTMAALNNALAAEIRSDLHFQEAPHGRAIRHAWRFDGLHRSQNAAVRSLLAALRRKVSDYIAVLPRDRAHPFVASAPRDFEIGGWAVVSGRESHHRAHLHPRAWATGVYYVVQPAVSRASQTGWLRVGPPAEFVGDDAWETRMIEPAEGSFVLMPGYFWHETEPMGVDQERICVAFEVRTPELALGSTGQDY